MEQECDPNKVKCTGDGLVFGYINQPITANIDTTSAGPGELTVYCKGPHKSAYCELREEFDCTYTMVLTPQEMGLHDLHVQFDGQEVPGSPFALRVSSAGLVKVHGPGLMDNLIHQATGTFLVQTADAGVGEVKVRVGGPKGRFKVETEKKGRDLLCRYNPNYPGMYTIQITWCGDQVPGSPFQVYLCQTEEELKQHITTQAWAHNHHGPLRDIAL